MGPVLLGTFDLVNEITKSDEGARRQAQAWLGHQLAWERTLERLRGDEPAAATVPVVPAHREAA